MIDIPDVTIALSGPHLDNSSPSNTHNHTIIDDDDDLPITLCKGTR